MPRISPLAILSILIIFVAGLIPIIYNITLIMNNEAVVGSRFFYFGLGFIVILAGVYVFLLQQKKEQLQSSYSNLQNEHNELRENYEALQAHVVRQKGIQQQNLPRIGDIKDATAVPRLNSDQLYILQQLFPDDYRLRVKPLEGGYTNFGVFQVIPETTDNILLKPGFVVKFLTLRDIQQEENVYQPGGVLYRYPLTHTPGRPLKHWPDDQAVVADNRLGAVIYQLATLDANSQLQTLKSLYKQCPFEEFIPYLKLLFEKLDPWYELRLPTSKGPPLGGREGIYERLYRRRNDIQRGISQLLKSLKAGSVSVLSLDDPDLKSLEFPFLPERWKRTEFYNPIHWINTVLAPGQARYFTRATSHYSPVHGDLHTGNVLIEKGKDTRLWLIDFPNAHIGPSLQDFATLEADVKFNLIDMNQCSFDDWLKFEWQSLTPLKDRGYALNWPWSSSWHPEREFQNWQPEGELLKAWQLIGFLRSWVIDHGLIGSDVRTYYLALLHTTLPIVYRYSHTDIQKQCALTSAAWMCKDLIDNPN